MDQNAVEETELTKTEKSEDLSTCDAKYKSCLEYLRHSQIVLFEGQTQTQIQTTTGMMKTKTKHCLEYTLQIFKNAFAKILFLLSKHDHYFLDWTTSGKVTIGLVWNRLRVHSKFEMVWFVQTHGQVCEFFEQARVVQKLGLLEPSLAAKLLPLSGDEGEDDDGNSAADCNYADGQKTTGMKRKLRKWRKVMRSALSEICPDLGLENQPDIVRFPIHTTSRP